MLIVGDIKILVFLFITFFYFTLAYHHQPQHATKEDSTKWRERFFTNGNKNRLHQPTQHQQHYHHQQQQQHQQKQAIPVHNSVNDISFENIKLRHHSRYPNLDRFESKINNLHHSMNRVRHDGSGHYYRTTSVATTTMKPPATTTTTSLLQADDLFGEIKDQSKIRRVPVYNKVRHDNSRNFYRTTTTTTVKTTTPDDDLFSNYGDLLDEDEAENDYEDNWKDIDNDFEDEYEDDIMDDEDPFADVDDDDWPAEEPTEPPARPVSAFTKHKWDMYGTRSRVEESRRQQLNIKTTNEHKAVVAHFMKVSQEGQCRRPLPKVIPVQTLHPDPSKSYTPHCTILHRCAEDTGCCTNSDTRCGPKKQVPVHLYFYAKTVGMSDTKVERLTFYNHTECACLEKSKLLHVDTNSSTENSLEQQQYASVTFRGGLQAESLRRCICPEEFTPRLHYESRCSCDCDENNQDCIRMKKGKEYLSLTDRKCILDGQCGIPVCEYGTYLRQIGRCHKKQEKMDSYRKLNIN